MDANGLMKRICRQSKHNFNVSHDKEQNEETVFFPSKILMKYNAHTHVNDTLNVIITGILKYISLFHYNIYRLSYYTLLIVTLKREC